MNEKPSQLHPGLLSIRRNSYPFGFRDAVLFRGIQELVLQQANGIGCFGGSQAILALPSSEIRLLDIRTDYFVSSLPRPEFPVMAMTGKDDWRGRIIASNVGLLHDAYEGPFGDKFPGIEAADNRKFARNLLRVIADGRAASGSTWEYAFALISEIETDLARTTEHVLKSLAGSDWFGQLVPQPIRDKCAARAAAESSGFPAQAYLDLIDFKGIWKANWPVFEGVFKHLSPAASKNSSLRFIQQLNEVRKTVMHPSKRHYGGVSSPSPDTLISLRQFRDQVKHWAGVAKNPHTTNPQTGRAT